MEIVLSKNILITEVDEEGIILNTNSENFFGLNSTALLMWQALQEYETVEAAQEALLSQFEVDSDTLKQDLMALIYKLEERGLLEIVNAKT